MRMRRHRRVFCTLATILGTWPAGAGWASADEPAELPPIIIAADLAGPALPPGPVVPAAATEESAEALPVPAQFLHEAADLPAPAAPAEGQVVGGWRPLPAVPAPAAPLITSAVFSEEPPMVAAAPEPGPMELNVPRKLPAAGAEPVEMVKIVDAPPAPHYGPPPVPREQSRVTLPPYIIDPPDVLLIESTQKLPDQPIRGQHLIRPDGTVGLGIYGSVYVAGMTLDQAKEAIARTLATRIKDFEVRNLAVDVAAYNSKYYYVISDGGGYGEQVTRFPVTGNETVLDAISQIGGLGAVSSKKHIWVARTTGGHHHQQTLPVDWVGITHGRTETNYQVMPNDRVYVKAKPIVTFDTALGRMLSPIERLFGVTLLGANTVNQISGRGFNNNNNNFGN